MSNHLKWIVGLMMVSLVAPLLGGKRQPASKPLFPVTGRVLFDDQPTPGALIVFHPVSADESGRSRPFAFVDKDSWYTLGVPDVGEGAPAGD